MGSAKIVGIGAQYKQNKCLAYDIGIAHSFFDQMPIDNTNPLTSSRGHQNTQTTVYGLQVTWDI